MTIFLLTVAQKTSREMFQFNLAYCCVLPFSSHNQLKGIFKATFKVQTQFLLDTKAAIRNSMALQKQTEIANYSTLN